MGPKPKPRSKAVTEVGEMAREAIAEAISRRPSVANFFHNMTPETVAATLNKKRKSSESVEPLDVDDADGTEGETDTDEGPSKRVKYNVDDEDSSNNDNNDNSDNNVQITYYCNVQKDPPPVVGKGKGKPKKVEWKDYTPFVLPASASYSALVVAISRKLPCSVLSVPEDELKWRKATPLTATPVLMGGEIGYRSALIPKLQATPSGQREVMLYMPKPISEILDPKFDYDTLKDNTVNTTSTHSAIAAQQETFDKQVQNEMSLLKAKYPIGTHASFPDKRIYTQPSTGALFDLTHIKLSSWANHMSQGNATVDTPPTVAHFDYSQRIKKIPSVTPTSLIPTPVPTALTATPLAAAPSLITNALGGVSLTDLIALRMLQDFSLPNTASLFGQLTAPVAAPIPSSAPSSPSHSVESVDIPLDLFCSHYKLSEDDFTKLALLGYVPGDVNINKLGPEMWQAFAGFAPLAWNRILDIHKRFLTDIRRGNWSHLTHPPPNG